LSFVNHQLINEFISFDMNIYALRSKWRFFLLICAVIIGVGSLLYTNYLVDELSVEERKKIEIWADAYRMLIESDMDEDHPNLYSRTTENPEESRVIWTDCNLDFYFRVIENNTTIPVIWVDKDLNIIDWLNLAPQKAQDTAYVVQRLEHMKNRYEPITINLGTTTQYIYYEDSMLLYQLAYYPYIQLGIVVLFVVVAYFAFSSSRKSEQNQVWVGLSKETAHQLGTPISSLLAITEMLKLQIKDHALIDELEKDAMRLNAITERFSKIGSKPAIPMTDIGQAIANSLTYIRKRSSDKVKIYFDPPKEPLMAPLSEPLFSWVIENLCKNALDAMAGSGTIKVEVKLNKNQIITDVSDTGKGIPKRAHKTIFEPGYTTKSRGWGLGLSLTKRIVEDYHNGRIFVLRSEPEKGTTFRIILKGTVNVTFLRSGG
jgi:signal transduction histidine kinase